VFDTITPTGIFDGRARITAWRNALAARQSMHEVVTDDYTDRLKLFLKNHDAWLRRRGGFSVLDRSRRVQSGRARQRI
jgi:glutathione S-transferase